jgi:hypothetical protein
LLLLLLLLLLSESIATTIRHDDERSDLFPKRVMCFVKNLKKSPKKLV